MSVDNAQKKPSAPPQPSAPLIPRPPANAASLQLSRSFQPITDEAAWALAERIKQSTIIPKDFIGRPDNIFIAILMGREVGLNPMQAVQNIMVVNGRPCMWGDALPALVYASNKVEKFEEEYEEGTKTAICRVRRKGDEKDHVQKFSWADAMKAGYDKKSGPWQTNPKRMLQMRARAFALRDKFADVLKGLGMVEEAEDYEIIANAKPVTAIKMPTEVVDVVEKAEEFAHQAVEQAAVETADTETKAPKHQEDPRIVTAKKKFKETFAIEPDQIDEYLAACGFTEFGEIYPRLQVLYKDIKAGRTTLEKELQALNTPQPGENAEPADDMFGE